MGMGSVVCVTIGGVVIDLDRKERVSLSHSIAHTH